MKKQILIFTAVVCGMTCTTTAYAQFKIGGKKINVGKYNPQIEMFARFKMKSSFHKTKRII